MDQLPDLVKALALSALSFHICALRPLLAGNPFENLFEHFYLQDEQGSLHQRPLQDQSVYLTSTQKVLTFLKRDCRLRT